MDNLNFVRESSNAHKVKSLIVTLIVIIVIIALAVLFATIWYGVILYLQGLGIIPNFGLESLRDINLRTFFYIELIGGLFFGYIPDEILFYYVLLKGSAIIPAIFIGVLGYMIAQLANYWAGIKLGTHLFHLMSKRKLYATRRFSNKYGALGIFLFNLLPLPSPLLTFTLASTNYNFKKLMLWSFLGRLVRYILIAGLFLLTT